MTRFIIFLLSLLPSLLTANSETIGNSGSPKNYLFLGDSMTWLGGDKCDNPKGWTYWFAKEAPEGRYKSYARSGATLTNTKQTRANLTENVGIITDCNTIYNQILRVKRDLENGAEPLPEVIIVGAGGNDAWFQRKRPLSLSMTALEAMKLDSLKLMTSPTEGVAISSAVRQTVLLLRQIAPDAQIVFLTPNQSASIPEGNLYKVSDIIAETCELLNVPVIRQDTEGPISAMTEKKKKTLTYDGTHTSEAGGEALGKFVWSRVSNIICKGNGNKK